MPVHLLNVGTNGSNVSSVNLKSRNVPVVTPVVVRHPTPRTPVASALSALFTVPFGKTASPNCVSTTNCTDENTIYGDNTNHPSAIELSMVKNNAYTTPLREQVQEMKDNLSRSASSHFQDASAVGAPATEKNSAFIGVSVSSAEGATELSMREPETRTTNDPGTPLAEKVIDLTHWSLVMVPNNPNVTKRERSTTPEWIVLVGKRADMVEMWHSSLITDRRTAREIVTGSGRIYQLGGSLDEGAMIEAGFSFELVESFRNGFPEDWKDCLLREFSAGREGRPTKLSANNEGQGARGRAFNNVVEQGRIKRRASLAGTRAPTPKVKKGGYAAQEDSNTDSPYEPAVKHRRKSAPQPRQHPHPHLPTPSSFAKKDQRWRDNLAPVVTSDATILGTTRSGRRVFKPFPYWENKYLGKDLSSPLRSTSDHRIHK